MSDNSDNPYAAPYSSLESDAELEIDSGDEVLAGRLTRFVAALLDGILLVVTVLPLALATGTLHLLIKEEAGVEERLLTLFFANGVMLALNGYLLVKRGQTIGKLLTKIQIVDFKTNRLLPFSRVCVFRHLWDVPLSLLAALNLDSAAEMIDNFIALIDVIMIFGGHRRCLHDLIAGSKVVVYKKDRPRLA